MGPKAADSYRERCLTAPLLTEIWERLEEIKEVDINDLEARINSGAYAFRITQAEALRENIAIETARIAQVI